MLVYLDSVICIYAVEGAPSFQTRARARLATMRVAGDQPAISDLLADALQLAAAVEGGCGLFLTNDRRLSGFPDIPVEVLP